MLYSLKQYEDSVTFIMEADDVDMDEEDKNDELRIADKYWGTFGKEMNKTLSVSYQEISGLLSRLVRKGCYVPITSMTLGYRGNIGGTTEVFEKLIAFIEMNGEDFVYFRKAEL